MDILFSIIGLGLLVLGAEIIIRGSVSFGRKINISLFAIGVVIVAGGTSLPELASSINAVLNDFSDLALGAVVGSNIANLILVMATTTLIFPIVNINKNQINQAWINIILGIVLIIMTFFYFNFIFGLFEHTLKTSLFGIFLGSIVPEELGLAFAIPLTFLSLIIHEFRKIDHLIVIITSGLLAILFYEIPFKAYIIAASLGALMIAWIITNIKYKKT